MWHDDLTMEYLGFFPTEVDVFLSLFFNFSLRFDRSGIICTFVFSKSLAYNVESESSNQYIKQEKNFLNFVVRAFKIQTT